MKKIYTLFFAALCAVVVLSCSKETIVETTTAEEETTPVAQSILNPVTLTFEIPEPSKVAIDDKGVAFWEEGDKVKIICFDADGQPWPSDSITVVDGKITATVEDAEVYYAVYPASAAIDLVKVGDVDNLKVTIADKQDGTFKNACYYAAKTTKTDKTFNFKAISGILKFQADPAYKKMDIRDVEKTSSRHAFAQTETCTFDADGNVTVTPVANISSMISITLDGNGTYYAAICGNAVNEAGFRFSKDAEDTPAEEKLGYEPGVFYNNLIKYEPTIIKNFGKLTDKIVTHVYVSPEGTGDGLSADNAAPASDLAEACLGKTEVSYTAVKGLLNYTGVWNCFRLDGLTIHFAEGEYANNFKVQGNNSSFAVTLQGEEGTVLKGAITVSATRVPSATERGTLTTFKNFTFTNTNTSATDNIALTIATGRCNIEGCTFTGCTTRAAQIGGNSATDKNLQVNFKNCLFSANTEGSKGAVNVPDGTTGGILGFNNCRFENNVAESGNGSAIYAGTGKTAIFLNKCTFIGNTCTTKANAFTIGTNDAATRFGMNCCTVNAGKIAYTNGASLQFKGQSVIVNSTVWTSGQFGKRGLVSLGCATSTSTANGASIINSVIRQNGTDYPAVYLHESYYQNLKYCLHQGAALTVEDGKHTVENTVNVSAFNSPSAKEDKTVEGIKHYYYTWKYTNTIGESGFTKPSKDEVRAAVAATGEKPTGAANGIGGLFLAWLDEVDPNAFTTDLIGTDRPENGICPGSVEQAN